MGGRERETEDKPRLLKSIWALYNRVMCGNDQQSDDAMP